MATVLLVDDDAAVQQIIEQVLTENGHRVITAASADDAMRALSGDASIDLLVTDIVLPGVDGFALAIEAKRVRPALRLLYISGFFDPALLVAQQPQGPILRKPFQVRRLLEAVGEVLET